MLEAKKRTFYKLTKIYVRRSNNESIQIMYSLSHKFFD